MFQANIPTVAWTLQPLAIPGGGEHAPPQVDAKLDSIRKRAEAVQALRDKTESLYAKTPFDDAHHDKRPAYQAGFDACDAEIPIRLDTAIAMRAANIAVTKERDRRQEVFNRVALRIGKKFGISDGETVPVAMLVGNFEWHVARRDLALAPTPSTDPESFQLDAARQAEEMRDKFAKLLKCEEIRLAELRRQEAKEAARVVAPADYVAAEQERRDATAMRQIEAEMLTCELVGVEVDATDEVEDIEAK